MIDHFMAHQFPIGGPGEVVIDEQVGRCRR